MAIDKFPCIFKKFMKSPIALMTRNQISTWPIWKSDFFSLVQPMISQIFWKCMEISQWPSLILTHTGISIFSLNHAVFRLTKIMNNLLEHIKIRIFKVIISVENWLNLSKKKIYEEYLTRRPTFIKIFFWKFWFLRYFIF